MGSTAAASSAAPLVQQYCICRLGLFGTLLPYNQCVRAHIRRHSKQTATLRKPGTFVALPPNIFQFNDLVARHAALQNCNSCNYSNYDADQFSDGATERANCKPK
jgi:hypothetical protein